MFSKRQILHNVFIFLTGALVGILITQKIWHDRAIHSLGHAEMSGMVAMAVAYEELGATNIDRHTAYNYAITNLVFIAKPK